MSKILWIYVISLKYHHHDTLELQMRHTRFFMMSFMLCVLLTACKKEQGSTPVNTQSEPAETATPASKDLEAATTPAIAETSVPTIIPTAEFDVESVPISDVTLPPFPFFKTPEGLVNSLDEYKSMANFDQHYFLAGKKLRLVEGKLYHNEIKLINPDKSREYSPLEFQRNYENAILALGGKKISEVPLTRQIADEAGGLKVVNKNWKSAAPTSTYEHASYLLRNATSEYWIHVSTSRSNKRGYIVVLEKAIMKQSLGFLDASAMKKALEADGRVALYINFDIDKATLRADSQGVVNEINTLMSSNPEMKLSIEGHTDSTGAADHNRTLSAARARSVLGALVGLGIDPTRLSSKGFGPDKPLADNADETGRAKNRRVELVKM
jgi:OmpA-OmpF porin, OOP family